MTTIQSIGVILLFSCVAPEQMSGLTYVTWIIGAFLIGLGSQLKTEKP